MNDICKINAINNSTGEVESIELLGGGAINRIENIENNIDTLKTNVDNISNMLSCDSTKENIIGMIDGHALYRKQMSTNVSTSADINIDLGFIYSKIINMYAILIQPNGNTLPCPYYYNDKDYNVFFIRSSLSVITIRTGANYGSGSMCITFEYLKD